MIPQYEEYDVIVIGSGPAGQNAAVEGAKSGARALIVEREAEVGGACVQHGTIPSKTLRETAVTLTAFRKRSGGVFKITQTDNLRIESLMTRLEQVVNGHQENTRRHLELSGVERVHGHARFVSAHAVQIQSVTGEKVTVKAKNVIIATGSRPRTPPNIPVDHENFFDSDSVLSMTYLPRSLTVIGGGVIACEYASVFAALGVRVVMIDKWPRPLGFLDPELVDGFLKTFEANDCQFLGSSKVAAAEWDGASSVRFHLEDGDTSETDKALVAQGRIANVDNLNLSAAGLTVSDHGLILVNENCETCVAGIYAVGDVIGPPALASSSMAQGRRAVCHALGIDLDVCPTMIPTGIYTIPEIATVGLNEQQAAEQHGSTMVGRARFAEMARGQIMATSGGLLKLVADARGNKILGVQIVGEGAVELIHLGQMALMNGVNVDAFADSIFNFPTLAEAYRLAALEITHKRLSGPDTSLHAQQARQPPDEQSEDSRDASLTNQPV